MPELPEVETVVRDLNKKVIGRAITAVWFDWPKMIKSPGGAPINADQHADLAERFKKGIMGERIIGIKRRGKNILIYLSRRSLAKADRVLLIHQKMTGHLLVGKWQITNGKAIGIAPRAIVDDSYNHYVHLIFDLSSPLSSRVVTRDPVPMQLGLSDLRKFAKVILGRREQIENLEELQKLGPDALDQKFSSGQFYRIVQSGNKRIKQVLMDQTVIAGIGNIYSDDILWQAKIHPERKAKTLQPAELKRLYAAMRSVLRKAVKLRGTSTSDFRDTAGKKGNYTGQRLVYQREGESCKRCKTLIKRIIIGGRSAHFCPACQRLKP